jgi:hypothetical protein
MALLIRILTLWPALAGLGVTVAIIPMTTGLGKLLAAVRRESMAAADARVKLITEVITGEGLWSKGSGRGRGWTWAANVEAGVSA